MSRSVKPSVWIQPYKTKRGFKSFRVRRTVNGRELPSIPCGEDRIHAERVKAAEKTRLWERRLSLAPGTSPTIAEHAAAFNAERDTTLAASTRVNDDRAFALLSEYMGGEKTRLDAVDKDALRGFKNWLLNERTYTRTKAPGATRHSYKPNGVRILLRSVKTFMRAALKEGKITADPFINVELPAEEDVANPPSDEAMVEMWKTIPPMGQIALKVDGALGLRRGEIFSLRDKSFTPPIDPEADPDDSAAHWTVKVLKSKTRRGKVEYKILSVPDDVMAALDRLRPWPKDAPLFPMHESTLSSWVRKAARKAGIGRTRLHDFRHRWATELQISEKDETAVMQAGGWTSKAAMARYQHGNDHRRGATLRMKWRTPPPTLHTDALMRFRKKKDSSSDKSS